MDEESRAKIATALAALNERGLRILWRGFPADQPQLMRDELAAFTVLAGSLLDKFTMMSSYRLSEDWREALQNVCGLAAATEIEIGGP